MSLKYKLFAYEHILHAKLLMLLACNRAWRFAIKHSKHADRLAGRAR
jgi:hypothetical protein